jgi:hypothetical protein
MNSKVGIIGQEEVEPAKISVQKKKVVVTYVVVA